MKYNAVIFDMDGTILNTLDDLKDSVNHVLEQMGYPARTAAEIAGFMGNGLNVLARSVLPEGTDAKTQAEFSEAFKIWYKDHMSDQTRPYDGVMELLKTLRDRGVKTAVVSNKFDAAVKLLSDKYFDGFLMSAVGESETVRKKPAPDGVLLAMEELGVSKEETLYVGDSEVDVETARCAGIPCVGVTWGFRAKEALIEAHAAYLVDTPAALLDIVL